MQITCSNCGYKSGIPVLIPSFFVFGISSVLSGITIGILLKVTWWFLLATPVIWFAWSYLIWNLPLWIPSIIARFRRCKKCSQRCMHLTEYSGFGL